MKFFETFSFVVLGQILPTLKALIEAQEIAINSLK